jgi:hypothetical protein
MDSHDAIVYLAFPAAPLPLGPHGVRPTFAHPRLVDHSHGLRMCMLRSDDLLTTISQSLLIPLDGFKKTL